MEMNMTYVLTTCLVLYSVHLSMERLYEDEENSDQDYVTVLERKYDQPLQHPRIKKDIDSLKMQNKVSMTTHIFKIDANNVAFVFWKHAKSSVIFIITCQNANTTTFNKLSNKGCNSKSNFYRSSDNGQTFRPQTKFKDNHIHSIFLSPLDTKFIILTDFKNRSIYITRDEGLTYEKHSVKFSPTYIHFHPVFNNTIVAFDNTVGGGMSAYVSEDYGVTWKLVSTRVRNYYWAQKGYDKDLKTLHLEIASGKQIEEGVISSVLAMSTSPYNIVTQVYQEYLQPFSVYVGNEFMVVQEVAFKKLYVSVNRTKFVMMTYKTQLKRNLHHVVLSSKNNELLLGITHYDDTSTLYLSDNTGAILSLLQTDVVMEAMTKTGLVPKMDFYKVNGLYGTYIINKKINGTLITFDKGHTWNHLVYNLGEESKCVGECDLTLYIKIDGFYTDYTAPMLSKDSAPGIIIAQGYIGNLSIMNRDVNNRHHVFISIDGGLTWKKSLETSNGYAILDHGGVIVATQLTFTIDHDIKVTTDYASTWVTFPFTKYYARISAIITDSTAKSLIVNVFGFLQDQTENSGVPGNTWIVWSFDFSEYFNRSCDKNDLFYLPHNRGRCSNGEKISTRRRNSNKYCYIGAHFVNTVKRESCTCLKSDYVCDTMYNQVIGKNGDYTCTAINKNHTTDLSGCKDGGTYFKSKGYRKLNGNKCSGGINLNPVEDVCPVIAPEVIRIDVHPSTKITVAEEVHFSLVQSRGFFQTQYIWDFGDGEKGIIGAYSEVKDVSRVFYEHGHYTVNLLAVNSAGNSSTSVEIVVIDELLMRDPYIKYEEPVIANIDGSYSLQVIEDDGTSKNLKHLTSAFYLWAFGGVLLGGKQSSIVTYAFPKTGMFRIEASIITPVSHKTVTSLVVVHYNAVVFFVTFSSLLDYYNTETESWRINFSYKFKMFLAIKYDIHDMERIIAKTEPKKPTQVQVILVDSEATANNPDKSASYFANKIIKDINENNPLLHEYASRDIHVVSASSSKKWQRRTKEEDTKEEGNAWIYILTTFIVLFVLGVLIAVYQFRKNGKLFFWRRNDGMDTQLFSDVDDDVTAEDVETAEMA